MRFSPLLVTLGVALSCGGDDINPVQSAALPGAPPGGSDAEAEAGRDAGSVPDAAPPSDGSSTMTTTCYPSAIAAGVWVADASMCVQTFAQGLGAVRQMAFAPNGDLFVNNGTVTVLWDGNRDGTSGVDEQKLFATAPGLNHGVAFSPDGAFVYASSPTAIYRWPYTPGLRAATAPAETVLAGLPAGGHNTRTLAFDSRGRLLVTVGSASNVDTPPDWVLRGQIRRFTLPGAIPTGGIDYATGEVLAHGMRNEVGLTVDESDRVWSVENGRDDLSDPNLGGDIHGDNPGEEINLVDGNGPSFYGYPLCFSEGKLPLGKGPGTQWADKTLDPSIMKTDAWCQDVANVHPPAFVMQAHWAPLGIVKYTGTLLPFGGDFLITAHGSWDRNPAVGHVLARAHVASGVIVSVSPIVGALADGGLFEGAWDARPVDVRQAPDQTVYVSDDAGGRVFRIGARSP